MFRRLALASIFLVLACNGVPDEPFEIRLRLNPERGCQASCTDYPMNCVGALSVRIVPAEFPDPPDAGLGEDAGVVAEPALAEHCVTFGRTDSTAERAPDLCSLGEVPLSFQDLPAEMVRIQVAVWSVTELGTMDNGDPECPKHDIFNLTGGTNFDPQPAVAGWGYFDLSEITVAEIDLACGNPEQLTACVDDRTLVNARVENLESLVFVDGVTAGDLRVSVAEPVARQNDMGDLEYVIPAGDHELTLEADGPVPTWFATVDDQFEQIACVEVLNRVVPQSTASVVCKRTVPGNDFSLNGPTQQTPAAQAAAYLPKAVLDEILAAASLPGVPEKGLVIGRVVDHLGSPEADVTVDAETEVPSHGEVLYLDADRMGLNDVQTTSNGYFVAREVPFGTRWTALSNDGRGERGEYVAGLVVGKITVLVIRLEPPPIQP
jgi:hypothetical protein